MRRSATPYVTTSVAPIHAVRTSETGCAHPVLLGQRSKLRKRQIPEVAMVGNSVLLIDLENFHLGRESNFRAEHEGRWRFACRFSHAWQL